MTPILIQSTSEHETLRLALIDTLRASSLGTQPAACSGVLIVLVSQLYQRLHRDATPEQIADAIWDGVVFNLTRADTPPQVM